MSGARGGKPVPRHRQDRRPARILARTGPLTPEERAVVQTHTEIGHWLLADRGCPVLDLAAEIALHHHENMDGSGYPHALLGDAIPDEAVRSVA